MVHTKFTCCTPNLHQIYTKLTLIKRRVIYLCLFALCKLCFDDCCKKQNNDTLFIGIIRNPIYWLNSFIQQPYHIANKNKNLNNFLFSEFYSICDEKKYQNSTLINGNISFLNKIHIGKGYEINKKDLKDFYKSPI